jgi:hypothetical protein
MVPLEFPLIAQPGNHQVDVKTRATIKNVHVVKPASDKFEVFTYGVQFVDLEPAHYTLLQNMTYEVLIADRQKIVQCRAVRRPQSKVRPRRRIRKMPLSFELSGILF